MTMNIPPKDPNGKLATAGIAFLILSYIFFKKNIILKFFLIFFKNYILIFFLFLNSLLIWSLGMTPFKDDFWTTDNQPGCPPQYPDCLEPNT
jgi:hypothetical protein